MFDLLFANYTLVFYAASLRSNDPFKLVAHVVQSFIRAKTNLL